MEVPPHHDRAIPAALALVFLLAMALSCGIFEILQGVEKLGFSTARQQDDWKRQRLPIGRHPLARPGSSPPICRSRCGACFPCRPAHVSIQPGQSVLLEYYPEAWRCKCGDKLFIP